jgi:hypothetical protein
MALYSKRVLEELKVEVEVNLLSIRIIIIVFQGNTYDVRYPYVIIGIVSASGMVAALFLPETLHQRLPETLADAHAFGRDQKFWSLPEKPIAVKDEMSESPLKS